MRDLRTTRWWVLGLMILIAGSAATVYYLLHGDSRSQVRFAPTTNGAGQPPENSNTPVIRFHGIVVDEARSPVHDAEVSISIWKVPPGWSSRKGPPLHEATDHISLRTDASGRFNVTDKSGYMLQILDIRKPGYVWLIDLAWSLPNKVHPDNRFFIYGGGFPIYVPDEAMPAVFPLHRQGSAVAGMPSRGGADRAGDGRVTNNASVQPLVPTTGPGAPATAIEAQQRLRALMRSEAKGNAASTQPVINFHNTKKTGHQDITDSLSWRHSGLSRRA